MGSERRHRKSSKRSRRDGNAPRPSGICGVCQNLLIAAVISTIATPTVLYLAANKFAVSTFLENAQANIEERLAFTRRPLDGSVWLHGDPLPDPKILLQTWRFNGSHRSGRDPRLAPLTCRIFHACQFADGTLLLPEALRLTERSIRACGLFKYVFARQASPVTQFDHTHAKFDLVAPSALPSQDRPVDQLRYFMQIIFSQYISRKQRSSHAIDYRVYNSSGMRTNPDSNDMEMINPENHSPFMVATSNPLQGPILGDARRGEDSWELVTMENFRTALTGFEFQLVEDAYPDAPTDMDPSSSGRPLALCYHSIMSTGERGDEVPRPLMLDSNPFYEANNMSRRTRWHIAKGGGDGSSGVMREDDGHLNIVIFTDGLDANDTEAVLTGLSRRIRHSRAGSTGGLRVSATQVSARGGWRRTCGLLQDADAVVCAGARAMGGLMYLRSRAVVVEVVRYSGGRSAYEGAADVLDVAHVGVMARADSAAFERCVDARWRGDESAVRRLVERWRDAARRFEHGDRRSHFARRDLRMQWGDHRDMLAACIDEQQELRFDADVAVRAIFDRAVVPRL